MTATLMTATLYGISNCDTVRKARRWLAEHDVDYHFHDFRKEGLQPDLVRDWISQRGWETVINRRGTSWRALSEDRRSAMDDAGAATAAAANPTLIKRPVLCLGEKLEIGFSADRYAELFSV